MAKYLIYQRFILLTIVRQAVVDALLGVGGSLNRVVCCLLQVLVRFIGGGISVCDNAPIGQYGCSLSQSTDFFSEINAIPLTAMALCRRVSGLAV